VPPDGLSLLNGDILSVWILLTLIGYILSVPVPVTNILSVNVLITIIHSVRHVLVKLIYSVSACACHTNKFCQ